MIHVLRVLGSAFVVGDVLDWLWACPHKELSYHFQGTAEQILWHRHVEPLQQDAEFCPTQHYSVLAALLQGLEGPVQALAMMAVLTAQIEELWHAPKRR